MNFPAVRVLSVAVSGIVPLEEVISFVPEAARFMREFASPVFPVFIEQFLSAYFHAAEPAFATFKLKLHFKFKFTPSKTFSATCFPATIEPAASAAFTTDIPPEVNASLSSERLGRTICGFESESSGLKTGTSNDFVNGSVIDWPSINGTLLRSSDAFPEIVNGRDFCPLADFARFKIVS